MNTQKVARAPVGLDTAGKSLWRAVAEAFDFDDPREKHALAMACQLADDVARLRSELAGSALVTVGSTGQPVESPLLGAIRNAVALQAKLLGSIGIDASEQARSHAGRALVAQRWAS
jgi:hypothetical protein